MFIATMLYNIKKQTALGMALLLLGTIGLTQVIYAQNLGGTNYCGDGVLHTELGEVCDDGNFDNNDGCSSNCEDETITSEAVDPSFVEQRGKLLMPLAGETMVYAEEAQPTSVVQIDRLAPVIPKSVISHNRTLPVGTVKANGKEVCDDGDENGIVCEPGYGGKCFYCSEACEIEEVAGSECGDGRVDYQHEECDDGNSTNGDGCSASCTKEKIVKIQLPAPTKLPVAVQKVDIIKTVEPVKKVVVQQEIKVEVKKVVKETPKIIVPLDLPEEIVVCGDSIVQTGEECDDGNFVSGDGCNSTCLIEVRDEPVVTKIMVGKAKTRVQRSPKKSTAGIGVTQPYPQQLSETGVGFFLSSFSVFLFMFMMMGGGVLVMKE